MWVRPCILPGGTGSHRPNARFCFTETPHLGSTRIQHQCVDDPYYSPSPLLILDRPLALVGFLGARVPQTAAMFSALTGVPLLDLERMVEHRVGSSLVRFVLTEGLDALHTAEEALLRQQLRLSPPPVLALGPATLQHPASARLIRRHATLVYIQRDMLEMYGNLLDELDDASSRCWMMAGQRPGSVGDLLPAFAGWRPSYERAQHTLNGSSRSPTAIANELVAQLQQ